MPNTLKILSLRLLEFGTFLPHMPDMITNGSASLTWPVRHFGLEAGLFLQATPLAFRMRYFSNVARLGNQHSPKTGLSNKLQTRRAG